MSKSCWSLNELVVILIALPVLGILMGGIYSIPAVYITKCREPFFSLMLAAGLLTTVIGLGILFGIPYMVLLLGSTISIVALCVRRYFGPLDHNLEHFGMVHAPVLGGIVWVILIYNVGT